MLVLARQRDETLTIGGEQTVHVDLTPGDLKALRQCTDPAFLDLSARLLAATAGPIEVTVVDIRGDKVRLGMAAPRDVAVHRKEVYREIVRERAERAKAANKARPAPAR